MMGSTRRAIGSHHRPGWGESDEWLTPREWIDALGPFDLDPCSPVHRPWPTAARHYTIVADGLALPWEGRVWLNPPYSEVGRWLARLAVHGDGIACIFARTETRHWFRHVWPHAAGILFVKGRPTFRRPDGMPGPGNSGAPVALIAYGAACLETLATCRIPGALTRTVAVRDAEARTPLFDALTTNP